MGAKPASKCSAFITFFNFLSHVCLVYFQLSKEILFVYDVSISPLLLLYTEDNGLLFCEKNDRFQKNLLIVSL